MEEKQTEEREDGQSEYGRRGGGVSLQGEELSREDGERLKKEHYGRRGGKEMRRMQKSLKDTSL